MSRVAPSRGAITPALGVSKPQQASRVIAAAPFVRAITSRYSVRRSSFWRRLSLMLWRSRSGINLKFIKYRSAHWHFAPPRIFALLIRGEANSQAGVPMRHELAARLRPCFAPFAFRQRTSLPSPQWRARDLFIRYLTTCRSRKDPHPDTFAPAVFSSQQRHQPFRRLEEVLDAAPPVRRRVQRPAPVQELDDDLPDRRKPLNSDPAQPEDWRSGPRTKGSPFDVDQLAQQVIKAIDWRIIAQRERLGRA